MSSHIFQTLIPRKAEGLRATVLPDGRWLLFDQEDNSVTTLTAPAGILWELCDGQTAVEGLIQQLKELYSDTPAARLETETLRTLHYFLEQGLVINSAAHTP